jgi:murein DD-endopeptidase MepM/ murein hydrolase activator NlpD
MKHLGKIVIGSICAVLLGLTTLLIIEYRFFHDQAQKMLELKEEYRAYTQAVKKILNEYNAMKEQAAESGDDIESEETDSKDSFIVVNREPGYLKQSMINYARKQNLEFILKSVDPNEWVDYTDQIKKKTTKVAQGKKRGRRSKRTVNVQAYPKFYNDAYVSAPKDFAFNWPIKRSEFWLSSFFGPRRKPDRSWGFHYGIDMAACRGTPVNAAADGIIIEAHYHSGYGNTILISHNNKYKTRYAHLDKMNVSVGQKVEQGQLIGKVGSTGAVRKKKGRDASHLHFEIYAHGKQINPLSFFI